MTSASPPSPKITDCPWLWLMIFSATAMSAAGSVSSKYSVRMARNERMMTANEAIALARQAGVQAADIEHASPPVVPYADDDFLKKPKFDWMYALFTTSMIGGAVGTHFWRLKHRRTATS
jgi:hypothetical protein